MLILLVNFQPGKDTIRGYVEKKKDWIERARDYQLKEKKIKFLKQKAKDKNPDEFNFHMIRSKVRVSICFFCKMIEQKLTENRLFNMHIKETQLLVKLKIKNFIKKTSQTYCIEF